MNRRDFLKFAGLMSFSPFFRHIPSKSLAFNNQSEIHSNAIILVFDALSALNMSLYGYPRQTTPHLERFASRANVYHAHYSTGTFTTPGTASLLTGTYPWTHRAFHVHGTILEERVENNLFNLFRDGYHRLGYSHNLLAVSLLHQMRYDLDELKFAREMALMDLEYSDVIFPKDYNSSIWGEKSIFKSEDVRPTSLFLSHVYQAWKSLRETGLDRIWLDDYPQGITENNGVYYILEDGINWCIENLSRLPQPFLVYLHFLPPHHPYLPRKEFIGLFNDGYEPISKPRHRISQKIHSQDFLNEQRQAYDEYLAFADDEFGRLYDHLLGQGILDNTFFAFTSDHGQMFERGIWGHNTRTLFEPVIRVPMLISKPGQQERCDIFEPTSNIDLVPTLLSGVKIDAPDWIEGQIMPGYVDSSTSSERSIYAMDLQSNSTYGDITYGSFALIKGKYKLVHYLDNKLNITELYDLKNDPEELEDLSKSDKATTLALKAELKAKIRDVNQEFVP